MKGSRGKGVETPDGLISGFQTETLLHFVVQKLSVSHQIFVACYASVTDGTDHLEAVVEPVTAAYEIKSAGKEAVPERLGAVLACFASIANFAFDADGRT